MARRRYRRYRRKSGRWSPNIIKISARKDALGGEFHNYETLAENPVQTITGVSQAFTVKNFEITFTIEAFNYAANNLLESMTAYIMYVPQGMQITSGYYAEHPEYIMAYKYLGSPTSLSRTGSGDQAEEHQNYQPTRIRTRLSRKLQSGDSVILYIQGSNQSSTTYQYYIDGIVRWWSKAN